MKTEKKNITNKHSSRTLTARLPTLSHCPSWRGGGVLRSQGRLRSGVQSGGYSLRGGVWERGTVPGKYGPEGQGTTPLPL